MKFAHMNQRQIFADKLSNSLPRIIGMLNKNPLSQTFGSFDSNYWHFKTQDFSSGMYQENVFPLAYLWKNIDSSQVFQNDRVAEYIEGVFQFHSTHSHKDGSLDDYFPYERAFGATAFALVGLTEAATVTSLASDKHIDAFEKSGKFLSSYTESGKLSNHVAIAALAHKNLYELTHNETWNKSFDELIDRLISWQSSEGWFQEYHGCDLGYLTLTIEYLARISLKVEDSRLLDVLTKACDFALEFAHPDGSYGGEYGSRNTYQFYPGGVAILANKIESASQLFSYYLKGVINQTHFNISNDRLFCHALTSYALADNYFPKEVNPIKFSPSKTTKIRVFNEAQLFKVTSGKYSTFGSLDKGIFKIFKEDTLIHSDTGYIGITEDRKIFCQNKPNTANGELTPSKSGICIDGKLSFYSDQKLSLPKNIILRSLSLVFGRLWVYSKLIRFLMQTILIYNKKSLGISYSRKLDFSSKGVQVKDRISSSSVNIAKLWLSTDAVNTHVVASDWFSPANLLSWKKVTAKQDITVINNIYK